MLIFKSWKAEKRPEEDASQSHGLSIHPRQKKIRVTFCFEVGQPGSWTGLGAYAVSQ